MFKPIKTQKLSDNLYTIRTFFVNFYIYDTGEELIAFDTGINKYLSKIGFRKLNLDFNKVTKVFLTHSDFDHVGGLKLFKNAKVYLSKDEEVLITHKKPRRAVIYNKRITNYTLLNDLEKINILNTTVQIISTPGHTLGSAMYIVNDNILITGDTISIKNNTIKSFSIIQNMNHNENKKIVDKLNKEQFFSQRNIILTGHYGTLKTEDN